MSGNKIQLYSFQESNLIDQKSIESGISEVSLMGNAALGSLYYLRKSILKKTKSTHTRIIILAGPGNNGGDGLALAWFLCGDTELAEFEIKVYLSKPPRSESSLYYYNNLKECNLAIESGEKFFIDEEIQKSDIIIESLLGSGQKDSPRGLIQELLQKLLKARSTWPSLQIISLDVPAGLSENSNSRFVQKPTQTDSENFFPLPSQIHCYGVKKAAISLNPDLNLNTKCIVIPIGFHPNIIKGNEPKATQWPKTASLSYFKREPRNHKYGSGHGFIIGGSVGTEGALLMAAKAFFASGGGILHCFIPKQTHKSDLLHSLPSLMVHDIDNLEDFSQKSPPAILIGPGLTENDLKSYSNTILSFLSNIEDNRKIILDASATLLVKSNLYNDDIKKNTLLTPHTGEWKKLGALAIENQHRLDLAMTFQEQMGCMSLVKDAISILLHKEKAFIFPYPEPRLALAGSGDILAGIILRLFSTPLNKDVNTVDLIHSALALHNKSIKMKGYPNTNQFIKNISTTLKD